MGTNYYYHENPCPTCGQARGEVKHIGKSSAGWVFSFRGYKPEICSFKDWIHYWQNNPGVIWDECGEEISFIEFVAMVQAEAKVHEARNHSKEFPSGCWLDADGHSFLGYEFS